jgi:DNA-binding transcriptional LysR family regulator
MNISHLKYAVEVERTGSITQAAERLFMSQPNLSKAIKDLESTLGMQIFKRTPKGILPTKKGSEFLSYAKNIISQIDEMEAIYRPESQNKQRFSITVPRASYIAHAFTCFINTLDMGKEIDMNFHETNSMAAINDIIDEDYNLGIIRYQLAHKDYFHSALDDKGFERESVLKYQYSALMSNKHPLAVKDKVRYSDLNDYIEITHGDLMIPVAAPKDRQTEPERSKKRIYIYERGSQFDLLRKVPATYIWVSPMPSELLECYGLVQKQCEDTDEIYEDLLIYSKDYRLSDLDNAFIKQLYAVRDEVVVK